MRESNVKVELKLTATLDVPVITNVNDDYDEKINEEIDRLFTKFIDRPHLIGFEELKFENIDSVYIRDID
ncbi:hypothetical protein [uncultured Staphylococcus sp.]|uniref:hypothetical protein n=1 Tax=uncultured Staphylococcus sp. TaxID=189668 RepID=UPI0025E1533A|nr:hypothetical protein [uncultured Staphylococcus sp.]